ncbi:MAG: Asp-tRNA(Asn)/Glu-tRNA(Gln) amidotransferase subunit GatA [Deltaproteobacteria bacterium]|nr:Asp-tRNA(Asn)/Glu-tRNA(Gln) amidotransferase subunit GatA [Deltaproteobacteria bacterium]
MRAPLPAPTLAELSTALEEGRHSAAGLKQAALDRIAALDGELNAVIRTTPERAAAAAAASDARRERGERLGPLDGVPVLVKGLIGMAGVETDGASKILAGYRPPYDATAVARLEAAGAVIVGQTNLDELGMGSATVFSAHGACANPWDPERTPGGSSGGSAAAVAAGYAPLALGTDTGGSIRQPAALCGVAGLKPSYGRVSRRGLFAFASSLDQIGPMAPRVADLVPLFRSIAGGDPLDATCRELPVPEAADCAPSELAGLTIGLPAAARGEGVDSEVIARLDAAVAFFEGTGARVREVELPHAELGVACYYVLAPAEASSNLSRYDGVRFGRRAQGVTSLGELYARSRSEGFGPEVQRRILLGTFVLSSGYYEAYYGTAQRVRGLIARDFEAAFAQVDLILTPTSPTPAWRRDEKQDDPLAMYLADVFTIPASLAGLPALSLPAGFTAAGLPVGLQLVAPAFQEARLLSVGSAFEDAHDFAGLAPVGEEA